MKKLLAFACSVILLSQISVFGATTNKALITEYYSKRFVNLNYDGAMYHVDLKEVVGVFLDKHGHLSRLYSPNKNEEWKNGIFIMFRNGNYVFTDAHPDPQGKLQSFHQWLSDHPEFINMP